MRVRVWLILFVLTLTATVAFAQEIEPTREEVPAPRADTATPSSTFDEVAPEPVIPGPDIDIPSPVLPSELPEGYVPPPVDELPDLGPDAVTITADELRTTFADGEPDVTIAEENVRLRFRDIEVQAARGRFEHPTGEAVFETDVIFRYDGQEVTGERIELNVRTGRWAFIGANTAIGPEFTQGYLDAPIFLDAQRVEGIRWTDRLSAFDVQATTCNLEDPHYQLVARSMTIYPRERIVFRDVSAYILDRKIFTLPRFAFPIRDISRSPHLVPRVGQTAEEGVFLKWSYPYIANADQTGQVLFDIMTEKGFGHGLRHSYQLATAAGDFEIYRLRDQDIDRTTLSGRLNHRQRFGGILLDLASDLRSNSYIYAPQSTTFRNQLTLTRERPTANSYLNIAHTINDVFTRTANTNASLRHRQRFGVDALFSSTLDYTAFDSGTSDTARLTSRAVYEKQEEKFDWSISAQELTDLSDEAFVGGGRFAGIEKLPEILLVTDNDRLGRVLPFDFPATMKFSYGWYKELPAATDLERAFLEIDSPVRRYTISDTWMLSAGAGFRQYFYSDNTAQYAIDTSAELKKDLGERSNFSLIYRYQRPRGFTPFRFDFIGRYNTLNARLQVERSKLKLSLLGGYNFEQDLNPWQDITLRASYEPTNSVLLYTATGYNINRSRWRTLINQLRIRAGDDFKLDIGTRYDTNLSRLASVRGRLDASITDELRIQALAGYNGITRDFDYRSIMLTQDLHCWEASLVYVDQGGFFQNEGIYLNFRIKAFPLFTNYGIGPFGQALDTSVGQVY